jgi:hypothetical protein
LATRLRRYGCECSTGISGSPFALKKSGPTTPSWCWISGIPSLGLRSNKQPVLRSLAAESPKYALMPNMIAGGNAVRVGYPSLWGSGVAPDPLLRIVSPCLEGTFMAAAFHEVRSAGPRPVRLRTMIDATARGAGLSIGLIACWAIIAPCVQLGAAGDAVADEVRKWSDKGGAITKEGSLEKVEGNWVYLKLTDGQEIKLPLSWLSDADQAYLQKQGSAPPTADTASDSSGGARQPPKPASDYKGELMTVTTEGVGVDKKSAEEDAWRSAIRQVVGGYVDSETVVENDQLIRDKVITLSSAYVERASTKRTRNQDGLFYVTVEAAVRVTKLLDTLEQHSVAIARVDPESIRDAVARAQTQEEQEQARVALIARALRNYPENCMKVSIDGKLEITKKAVTFRIKVEPDMEAFAAVTDKLVESLTSTTKRNGVRRSSGEFVDRYAGPDGGRGSAQKSLLDVVEHSFPNRHQVFVQDKANDSPRTTCVIPSVFSAKVETESGPQQMAYANGQPDQRQNTYLYVPYRANKTLQRITWRWFLIDKDEFEQILKPLIHRVEFRSEILDEHDDLLSDDMTIMFYGWSGLNGPNALPPYGQRIVVAPFTMCEQPVDCYSPSFSFGRTVSLAPEELEAVRTVRCSVQAGSPIWREND